MSTKFLLFSFAVSMCAGSQGPASVRCEDVKAAEQVCSFEPMPATGEAISPDKRRLPLAEADVLQMLRNDCARAELSVRDGGCEGAASRPAGAKPQIVSFHWPESFRKTEASSGGKTVTVRWRCPNEKAFVKVRVASTTALDQQVMIRTLPCRCEGYSWKPAESLQAIFEDPDAFEVRVELLFADGQGWLLLGKLTVPGFCPDRDHAVVRVADQSSYKRAIVAVDSERAETSGPLDSKLRLVVPRRGQAYDVNVELVPKSGPRERIILGKVVF